MTVEKNNQYFEKFPDTKRGTVKKINKMPKCLQGVCFSFTYNATLHEADKTNIK